MKNLFKILALVLALTMAFGVAAFADTGDAPASLDITVGEIVSVKQLVEDAGYAWPSIPYTDVRAEITGGVCGVQKNNGDGYILYGAKAGQGSVKITVIGKQPFTVNLNVTAAVNPVTKEVSMGSDAGLSLEPMLAELGYTPQDIARRDYWDNFSVNGLVGHVTLLYGGSAYPHRFSTHSNGYGHSQILFNMKDGQIILVNVTIGGPPKDPWSRIGEVLGAPFVALFTPFGWPFLIIAPLFILYYWITGFINLATPAKQHQVTPVLTF